MDWRKPHLSADVPVLALPCPTQRPVTDPARQRQRERPQILALRGAFALGQTAGPGGGLRGSTADADDPRGPVSPAASARRHRFADIRDTRNASRPPGRKPPPRSARPPLTAPAPGGPAQRIQPATIGILSTTDGSWINCGPMPSPDETWTRCWPMRSRACNSRLRAVRCLPVHTGRDAEFSWSQLAS